MLWITSVSADQEEGEKKEVLVVDLPKRIEEVIALNAAGSPTDPSVKWTHLKPSQIAKLYEEKWDESINQEKGKSWEFESDWKSTC